MTRARRPILLNTLFLSVFLTVFSIAANAGYADTLKAVSKKDLVPAAWAVYFDHIRKADSSTAMEELDEIREIAADRNVHDLKVLSRILFGKYAYERPFFKGKVALNFFKSALDIHEDRDYLKAEILYSIGVWYYVSEHNYPLAFEYLLQAQNIADDIGYKDIPDADEMLSVLAVAHYQFGEYDKAIFYLNKATQLPLSKSKNSIELYNNLGLVYRDMDKLSEAAKYFNIGLSNAVRLNNEPWIGIISGNLGSVYHKLHDYRAALANLFKDYNLSTKYKQTSSAANAALLISQIYLEQKNVDSAQLMLQKGTELAHRCNDPRIYALLYRNFTKFYKYKGDVNLALLYTDSLMRFRDSIAKRNDVASLEKARNKIETETHLANIKLLESSKNKQILVRNGLLGIGALLFIIIVQSFRRERLRQRKNMEILELKQRQSYEELKSAQMQLDSYVDTLKQKNQMLEQFAAEIDYLHSLPENNIDNEKEDTLKRLQDTTILTEDAWLEFKKLFTKVHSSFFMDLHQRFPNLTQAETRILALSKLGLSVKEKANMLGISPDSVRRTQQRLSKKLGLSETEILDELETV